MNASGIVDKVPISTKLQVTSNFCLACGLLDVHLRQKNVEEGEVDKTTNTKISRVHAQFSFIVFAWPGDLDSLYFRQK